MTLVPRAPGWGGSVIRLTDMCTYICIILLWVVSEHCMVHIISSGFAHEQLAMYRVVRMCGMSLKETCACMEHFGTYVFSVVCVFCYIFMCLPACVLCCHLSIEGPI